MGPKKDAKRQLSNPRGDGMALAIMGSSENGGGREVVELGKQ